MATIRVIYQKCDNSDTESYVGYEVSYEGSTGIISTDYPVKGNYRDSGKPDTGECVGNVEPKEMKGLLLRIRDDKRTINRIFRILDVEKGIYSVADIVKEFYRLQREYSLFYFTEKVIADLRQRGKIRTSETYRAMLRSFSKFRSGADIYIGSLSAEILEAYEQWLRDRGLMPNSTSFYIRILRAVYNRAVDTGTIEDLRPFRHVYTGVDKTVKRAVSIDVIKKISKLKLNKFPALDYARDMFLMSFFLRGMSFVDMAFLRKSDLKGGYVVYRRRKTGQRLTIRWTHEMQEIINKYPANQSDYLLPIIRKRTASDHSVYRNMSSQINRNLKCIAIMVGLNIPLTMYVARHSWASVAKCMGVPINVISEGMGHESESTTQIYLSSLEADIVDRANSLILDSIK